VNTAQGGRQLADPTSRRPLRNFVLVSTMVSTAYLIFVVSVLASTFIDEFNLSRFELGLIGSLNTAVGALTAPVTGRLTDRIGPRLSSVTAQLIAAFGLTLVALSQSVVMLVIAACILGIPQGWGNPTTNALIAERVEPGKRGTITGIKQSGVTLGVFLAGLTLPGLAGALGWRWAVGIYAGIFAVIGLAPLLLPARVAPFTVTDASTTDVESKPYNMRGVRLIALYAFLMGTSGGAISRFLALFAEEEAGMSNTAAGIVVALTGLGGMAARIGAGKLAEKRIAPLKLLSILAIIGTSVSVLLLITLDVGAWVLWPVAALFAVGHTAWNAVAMLAIIIGVPKAQAGRASGAVMVGFLGGLAVGAPLAGLSIDATGSYQSVWVATLVLAAFAALVAQFAHRTAS
jgi:MFS family permease